MEHLPGPRANSGHKLNMVQINAKAKMQTEIYSMSAISVLTKIFPKLKFKTTYYVALLGFEFIRSACVCMHARPSIGYLGLRDDQSSIDQCFVACGVRMPLAFAWINSFVGRKNQLGAAWVHPILHLIIDPSAPYPHIFALLQTLSRYKYYFEDSPKI